MPEVNPIGIKINKQKENLFFSAQCILQLCKHLLRMLSIEFLVFDIFSKTGQTF